MSADSDASSHAAAAPGEDGAMESRVLRAAEAIADGAWPQAAASEGAQSLLSELDIIARVARVHRDAARAHDDAGGEESSDSLGDVLSRSIAPASSRPDLTHARRWGPLFVLERVGGGSFGEVYRAWDPALDREVALKLLRLPSASKDRASAFVREGQLLASVHHPNVINVHGAAQIEGEVGIWMEFVRGRTLERIVLEDGPMSAQEASVIAGSLCGALGAVHQQGLLHRDIKAANVMRASGGRIVLLDFGAGTEAVSADGAARRLAGTPLYMAPEVLTGGPATVQSDLYSLGVLLFFLVTGSFPVYGKTLSEVRELHRRGRTIALVDVRSDLPLSFVRVVGRALMPDRAQRGASAGELLHALSADARSDPARWSRYLALIAVVTVAVMLAETIIGALSSRYFNTMFGRSEVAAEGFLDWLSWGVVGSVAPGILLLVAVSCASLLTAARRLVVRVWVRAARWDVAAAGWLRRNRLDEPNTLAALALVVSLVAFVGATWYFSPLLAGLLRLMPNLSETPSENLAILARQATGYRQAYRVVFTWVTIVCVLSWYLVARSAWRRNEVVNPLFVAGGSALVLLSLFFLQLPYRLFVHSEFEAVTWRGAACYVLGQRADDLLLFCPGLPVPRNRAVMRSDPDLARGGGTINLFYDLENHP